MTTILNVHNVNQALAEGIRHIVNFGKREPSRNGDVLASPEPVVTEYRDPTARVLFSPMRDANPFFHLMEALWMLAGRNDVAFIAQFVGRMKEYSDDDTTLHGAYGHRWRDHFMYDQLLRVAHALRTDSTSRRVVLTMWDPDMDWGSSRDFPCNTHCYFRVVNGKLDMTVMCRSNDLYWGAHGANAVHFSFLLEYMAAATGNAVGVLRQFSHNYHFYLDRVPERFRSLDPKASHNIWEWAEMLEDDCRLHDRYTAPIYEGRPNYHRRNPSPNQPTRVPLRSPTVQWEPAQWQAYFDQDVRRFCEEPLRLVYLNPFFFKVAAPMFAAHAAYKDKEYAEAMTHIEAIEDAAWRIACYEWLKRREVKRIEQT